MRIRVRQYAHLGLEGGTEQLRKYLRVGHQIDGVQTCWARAREGGGAHEALRA